MTTRLNENNIVDYLQNFNKNRIRPTNHSNERCRERNFSIDDIIDIITKENPIYIDQQESKKFALIYEYGNNYIKVVIAIKDKFIDIPTVHKIGKK